MNKEAAEVIGHAAQQNLCTAVVVGIRPNGGGMYVNWSGNTIHSLVAHLEAAKQLAITEMLRQTEIDQDVEAAE